MSSIPKPNDYSIYYKYSNFWTDDSEKKNKTGIPWIPKVNVDGNDTIYIILPEEEGRPDKLSQKFYGTPYLDWFICITNGIKDPLGELIAGTKIIIPSQNKFFS